VRDIRSRIVPSIGIAFLLTLASSLPSFAQDSFNQTTTGTYDSNASGNWSLGKVPTNTSNTNVDDNFTMSFAGAITVTNFGNGGTLNYVRLDTTSSGSLIVISSNGFQSQFGLQLNSANDTLILAGNTTLSFGNNSFNDATGTLIVSNGATTYINIGANAVQNQGTIQLTSTGGQTSQINYGQSTGGALQNTGTGTIIKNGAGTGSFVGVFGANNVGFTNAGTITVNSGTLVIDPRGAFTTPFANTGTVTINTNANFVISRTGGAWYGSGSSAPSNSGAIFLAGGTLTALASDSSNGGGQAATNMIANTGSIIGNGVVALSVAQAGSGSTIASNGVLSVFGTYNGGQATFTSSGGQFGTMKSVSGGDLKIIGNVASGNAASWVVNAGGTMEVAGENADLGASFMPGSQLNGNVRVSSGGNLTLSGATGISGQTLQQNGTFEFSPTSGVGAVSIFMPNVAGLNSFTNAGTFILTGTASGVGTFESGFGAGNNNYGFVNSGTILAAGGGTLIINTSDANSLGFSNTASGTIVITNGSLLRLDRTAGAWTNANSAPAVNMGLMILSNATFQTATAGTLDQSRLFENAGTILIQGQSNVTNLWQSTLLNAGTILITNNNAVLQLGTANTVNWFTNSATGNILLGANGASGSLVATNGATGGQFSNLGTLRGQGTITLGRNNATGGQNANFVNAGNLVATNWGGSSGGSLFITVGNAFSNGGFSNTANGTISIASNMTLTVNRSENAWASSGNSVANAGTILIQGGSLDLAADGVVSNNASFINTGLITGFGTINSVVITTNGGKMIANATALGTSLGTLTASIASTTNNSTSTLGVVGTNSILNLIAPNSQNVLINFGTISLSGGSINLNGGAGTITNYNVIAGVGNASSFPIVNAGTLASFVAQGPISGLSNLIANVGVTNTGLLGANNLIGGAATLTLGTSTGGGLVNNGTLVVQGGFITVTNTAGVDAGVTNLSGLIYGYGTQSFSVVNLSGGTLLASNGILRLGMSGANAGVLSNLNTTSTVILTNTVLQNSGTIALNGGGLIMGGSTITNDGTIIGPGNYSSGLYNNPDGTVIAPNGTLALATNGATESVNNLGTFSIAGASTLSVGTAWNNTNGLVSLSGGTLAGSAVTNKGAVSGNGTIDSVLVNAAGGTLTVSGGTLTLTNNPTQNGNIAIGSGSTLTMALSSGTFANGGTINLAGGVMVFTNTVTDASFTGTFVNNGVIAGFGTNSLNPTFTLHEGSGFNPNFVNSGVILASNGLLMVNAADSFTQGGFSNAANGTIAVSNGATFAVNKTANYWTFGSALANQGTVVLNGGTVTLYDNGAETNGGGNANIGFVNNGTIFAQGTGAATNTWGSGLLNAGTIYVTNNNSVFNVLSMNALTNLATGQILLGGANGAVGSLVATNAGQPPLSNPLANQGTIEGQGTITLGVNNAANGANTHFLNSGTLIATNWGGATPGTLFISTGDAASGGGFENLANGTVVVATNMTLTINRSEHAWVNSGDTVTNLGLVAMQGGTLNFAADGIVSNAINFVNTGLITGFGTITSSISNSGTGLATSASAALNLTGNVLYNQSTGVLGANNGRLVVNAVFTNAGTVSFVNSVGTFNNAVVNQGAWISDPTTNVFNNTFTVAASGYISASAGDVYIFKSNFVNRSTQNTSYSTLNTTPGSSGASGTKFIFDNASAVGTALTQQFFTAALKLTGGFVGAPSPAATGVQLVSSFAAVTGFDDNFALDRLEIGNTGTNSTLELSASADIGGASGNTNALFVNDLWLFGSSDLIISNNTVLYFVNSNNFSSADITLLGNGEIHQLESQQLSTVPEPSVVLLWLCGLGTAYAAGRRAKNRRGCSQRCGGKRTPARPGSSPSTQPVR
jgi:hypothetical protein